MDHLEDLVFQGDIYHALYMVEQLGDYLSFGSKKIKITTKWDGAPAIVCGKDVDNNFFVATKSAFNLGEKKLCYEARDIARYHPTNTVLQEKLGYCLEYLPELDIENVLQGDLMYTWEDLRCSEGMIRFKPNVVEYCIPYNSTLGQEIYHSQLGIVFHTAYNNNLTEASYDVDTCDLKLSQNVWYRDASLTNIGPKVLFEADELVRYQDLCQAIADMYRNIPRKLLNTFSVNETIKRLTKRYVNDKIRKGQGYSTPRDGTSFTASGLINFASGMFNEEIAAAKKPETKANRFNKRAEMMDWFYRNQTGLEDMFNVYEGIITAKNMVLDKLNQMKDIDMGYHIPEGYVVSDKHGFVVKLIDRPTFSYENFKEKTW